jgi:prephenate dehydrogenase
MGKRILIIGLGLLGGSLGLALQEAGAGEVHGLDADPAALAEALALGLVQAPPTAGSPPYDIIVLAMPPGAAGAVAGSLGGWLGPGTLLTDVCSVKVSVIQGVRGALGAFPGFLPAHPMAGSHLQGPGAARADLFRGCRVLLTPLPETSPGALEAGRALWESLGATPHALAPEGHDQALALLSHLPHLLAYTLALEARKGHADPTLAGPAFGDMTRLAQCPPGLWADILLENRAAVLERIASYRSSLDGLAGLLEAGDREGLSGGLEAARDWKAASVGN